MTDTITVQFTEQQVHLLERLAGDWNTSVEDVVHRVLSGEFSSAGAAARVPAGAVAEVR